MQLLNVTAQNERVTNSTSPKWYGTVLSQNSTNTQKQCHKTLPAARRNCHQTVLLQNSTTAECFHSGSAKLAFPFVHITEQYKWNGQAEQDWQNRQKGAGRTGQADWERQKGTGKTGKSEQDRQTRQVDGDTQNRTSRTEQAEQAIRTGQVE